jgi:dihydroorotase
MSATLIKDIQVVNEGKIFSSDVLIVDDRIQKIAPLIDSYKGAVDEVNGHGLHLFPGIIDDQVHFRDPGLTHKADIHSESRAAVAGGVTSFMDMPNTNPQAVTQELLEEKYTAASKKSLANYSFFMGGTNTNLEELKKTDKSKICGIKIFAGSSTGNMLVDDQQTLESIFSECDNLMAVHSESEEIIRKNLEFYKQQFGDNIPFKAHPAIRSIEACFRSSEKLVNMAKKAGTRLHILHISTAEELALFRNDIPLSKKKITAEACVHHLWFDASDYETLGGLIKCNPAIKEARHKAAILNAVLNDTVDIIATDHAPHTWDEKQQPYLQCPSGLPLVQHSLQMMLDFYHNEKITLEQIGNKMTHAVAECFRIKERGYIREGYKADLVLVDLNKKYTVSKENVRYKCGWSPLEGHSFNSSINSTYVNGRLTFNDGRLIEGKSGERLAFSER